MLVDVSTELTCNVEQAVAHLKTPRLLQFVAAPLIRFSAVNPPQFPDVWSEGVHWVEMRLFGIVPLGQQAIVISMPPTVDAGFVLRDAGYSALIQVWDHVMTIKPHGAGVVYRDQVKIQAGMLTPVIWLFAHVFYRHRQHRWRVLVARNFDYGDT